MISTGRGEYGNPDLIMPHNREASTGDRISRSLQERDHETPVNKRPLTFPAGKPEAIPGGRESEGGALVTRELTEG